MKYSYRTRIWNVVTLSIILYLLSLLISAVMNLPIPSALAVPNISIDTPQTGFVTNTTSFGVSGVTEINTPVEVYIDDVKVGTTNSDAQGNWSLSLSGLGEGNHTMVAKATDISGVGDSNLVAFTVDLTPPVVAITSPADRTYINIPTLQGVTEPNLRVDIYLDAQIIPLTADDLGQWSYSAPQLIEGSHTIYAKATDSAGNEGSSANVLFNFDKTRPVVATDFQPPEDMTRVTLASKVVIRIIDASPMDTINMADALILMENGLPVPGTTTYDAIAQQIAFTPTDPLKPITRYSVYVNPLLKDLAGNSIFTRTWFFTTVGEASVENPHGNYSDNVNMCKNCHNTHRSDGKNLEKPNFETLPQMDIYCNACHDGTVAPIPNNWNTNNQHNFRLNNPNGMGADTCANCHNPHLNWTETNPNFLQDAYYYDHNDPTNPFLPSSSDQQLCEGCHEAAVKDDPRVTYELFKYKKSNTTTGTFEDYKLCLRCHDGQSAVDIATYYKTPSGHTITAPADGSPINGALACSDCHETHGSNNLKLLKEDLGHQVTEKFQTPSAEWDFATERQFCSKCHNNSTVVYGKTVHFNETISGHEITSIKFCNECHGGGSAIKAAHGPVTP